MSQCVPPLQILTVSSGEIVLQVADDHVNPVGTFIPVIHGGKTGIHVIVRMEIRIVDISVAVQRLLPRIRKDNRMTHRLAGDMEDDFSSSLSQ